MKIKTIGDLRKVIANLDDDFEIEFRVRRELTDDELKNHWIIDGYELGKHNSNVCTKTIKSKRALIRQILKWKLPKGCEVHWKGEYVGDDIIFKTL